MAQRKLRPFAEILNLVDALNDEQRADLLDYLRGKQPKKERKTKKAKEIPRCVTCGYAEESINHKPETDGYHLFRTEVKKKGQGA